MKDKISWTLGSVGGLIAIIVAWRSVGWMTPEAHEEDLHVHQNSTLSAIEAISRKMDVNRDEWRCDEIVEAIEELLSTESRSPIEEEMVRRNRAAYDKNHCERFEDDAR
jgi:hypothetical protein